MHDMQNRRIHSLLKACYLCCYKMEEGKLFWQIIELKMFCKIPTYLQNLLALRGFDNAVSIENFNDDDIIEMETYAKSANIRKRIPEDAKLVDYFGTFYNDPADFEILPGHKKLLNKIVLFVQQNIEKISKSKGFLRDSSCLAMSSKLENEFLEIGNMQNGAENIVKDVVDDATKDIVENARENVDADFVMKKFVYNEQVSNECQQLSEKVTQKIIDVKERDILFDKIVKWIKVKHPKLYLKVRKYQPRSFNFAL